MMVTSTKCFWPPARTDSISVITVRMMATLVASRDYFASMSSGPYDRSPTLLFYNSGVYLCLKVQKCGKYLARP